MAKNKLYYICPECSKHISVKSLQCPYCKEKFEKEDKRLNKAIRYFPMKRDHMTGELMEISKIEGATHMFIVKGILVPVKRIKDDA
jgi:predicted ATP-dependent serine protease